MIDHGSIVPRSDQSHRHQQSTSVTEFKVSMSTMHEMWAQQYVKFEKININVCFFEYIEIRNVTLVTRYL